MELSEFLQEPLTVLQFLEYRSCVSEIGIPFYNDRAKQVLCFLVRVKKSKEQSPVCSE